MMTRRLASLMGVLTLSIAACASVPMAPATLDSEAKKFEPPPGMAAIYINRGGGLGYGLVFQVLIDGRLVGSLAPYTYVAATVPPGDHAVVVTGQTVEKQSFLAEAGGTHFFEVTVGMGTFVGHPVLKPVSALEGRKQVQNSRRAANISD